MCYRSEQGTEGRERIERSLYRQRRHAAMRHGDVAEIDTSAQRTLAMYLAPKYSNQKLPATTDCRVPLEIRFFKIYSVDDCVRVVQ